jgi:hypothetical protein
MNSGNMKDLIPTLPTPTIDIRQSRHVHESGRAYLKFVPEFVPDIRAQGFLTFACWEVWEDEPQAHQEAMDKAVANAKQTMIEFAKHLRQHSVPS